MRRGILLLLAGSIAAIGAPLKEIRYDGLVHISNTVADEIVGIKKGDEIDITKVDESVKKFYEQGYFDDIMVYEENGVLVYKFQEKPVIVNIEVNGYESAKDEKELEKEISLKKGDIYDKYKINKSKRKIVEALQKEGYHDSVVEDKVENIEGGGLALTLNVNKGEKIIIKNANYYGADALSTSDFERVSANREREFMGWMWGFNDGKLKVNDLEFDSPRIKDLYMQKGYLDAVVSTAHLNADFTTYTAELSYNIIEGQKYYVSGVNINLTKPVIATEELEEDLRVKDGRRFNINRVRKDIEGIKEKVGNLGYGFARVIPDFKKDENASTVAITYTVIPGEIVHINDVLISGNSHTLDRVVRRDIFVAPGDPYNSTDLKDSKNALKRSGFFEDVTIEEKRVTEDKIDIIVKVKEGRTGELKVGAGYGSYGGVSANAAVSDRNILGSGMTGGVSFDISSKNSLYKVSLLNPRVFDSMYSLGGSVYRSKYEAYDYTETRTGASLTLGRKLTRHLHGGLSYDRAITGLDGDTANFNTKYYPLGEFTKSALTPGVSYDNTDDYLLPRSGMKAGYSLEYAGLDGDEKYTKNFLTYNKYFGLDDYIDYDLILRYRARAGYVIDNGYLPIGERFYLGGNNNVRGYSTNSISPKDEEGIRIGGKKSFTNSAEASIPLVEGAQLRSSIFYDYGTLGVDDFSEISKSSYGVAIEWVSPVGLIYLVFPTAISPKSDDKTSTFEFSMGRGF